MIRTPRILVAEDEPAELRLLEIVLRERGGYEVECASDGREALDAIRRGGVDLLVTDFVMPGLDGLQLANRAVEIDPALQGRILIATGAMYGREDALAFAVGAKVLVKPFTPDQLLTEVRALLTRGDVGY